MNGTKKTKQNIAKNGKLSFNLVGTDMLELLDYFGSSSGKDNIKNTISYDYEDGLVVHAPTLSLSKWVYECEVDRMLNTGDSDTYFCAIKNIQVIEEMRNSSNIDLTLLDPVIYSGDYHSLDKHLGTIGDFYKAK